MLSPLKITFRGFVATPVLMAVALLMLPVTARSTDRTVRVLIADLKAPLDVAVRQDPNGAPDNVFIVDRSAGKILQVQADRPGQSIDVIAGFPTSDDSSSDSPNTPGIQSLYFLDHSRLVVAGANRDRSPLLRLYDLSDTENTLKADDYKQEFDFSNNIAESAALQHAFHDLARTNSNDHISDFLVLAASAKLHSELWKVPVRANTLGDAVRFGNDKVTWGGAPVNGIAVAGDGHIVVATPSKNQPEAASVLQFLNPADGRRLLTMEIQLPRIVGLAFHPTNRNLYAASFGVGNRSGGVYRIDDASEPGKPAARVVSLAEIDRPTALAFGPEGVLYLTTLGKGDADNQKSGALVEIGGPF